MTCRLFGRGRRWLAGFVDVNARPRPKSPQDICVRVGNTCRQKLNAYRHFARTLASREELIGAINRAFYA